MLTLHEHLSPELRERYAEAYAKKLAPRYRLRKSEPGKCACDRYHGPDPRGLRVSAGRYCGQKAHWKFGGWQFDQAIADAFAKHVGGTVGELIRMTPRHNAIIAANPPHEWTECAHDLDDEDTCKHCGESFSAHLALKGAGLL